MTGLFCRPGEAEVQMCEINTRHWLKRAALTSPELTAHFAEKKADCQQAESGWSAKNTSSVVMQILPQATGESLGEKNMFLQVI